MALNFQEKIKQRRLKQWANNFKGKVKISEVPTIRVAVRAHTLLYHWSLRFSAASAAKLWASSGRCSYLYQHKVQGCQKSNIFAYLDVIHGLTKQNKRKKQNNMCDLASWVYFWFLGHYYKKTEILVVDCVLERPRVFTVGGLGWCTINKGDS